MVGATTAFLPIVQLSVMGLEQGLQVFLDHRPREEVQRLVSATTNGATPLVLACRNGHLAVVEYLLDQCRANIEQTGSVSFDGETIEGAPPLWCAAAAGHLLIVRLLTVRGANVNSTTKTNSTPLRAACFDGHFDIVDYLVQNGADIEVANRHGHTCLMIACYKGHLKIAQFLIERGADVNRKSVKGNTALHDCAESGSLQVPLLALKAHIMKLLLSHGARMDVDAYGMTPLLAAAVTGNLLVVEFLISESVVDEKTNRCLDLNVSREDRINALELLGATFVDKKRDMLGSFRLWKRAMQLRYDENGTLVVPKQFKTSCLSSSSSPSSSSPIAAYENTTEVCTPEALEQLIADPDAMRMQALLVRERILGPAHPDTSYYIRYRGAVYADMGHFERCITLWMYALEMQQKMLEPLSPMTQSSLLSFAELFSFMMSNQQQQQQQNGEDQHQQEQRSMAPPVNVEDIKAVFTRATQEVRLGQLALRNGGRTVNPERDLTYFHRTLVIVLHLICLLTHLFPSLSSEEVYELKKLVFNFLRLGAKGRNSSTPLMLACTRESSSVGRYPICQFPSIDAVELLLECGADPNQPDNDGNRALHLAATSSCSPGGLKSSKAKVISTLLHRGAHYDAVNARRETFEDVLRRSDSELVAHELVNRLQFTTLQCAAAKVVKKHHLRLTGISRRLQKFVDLH